MGFMFFLRCFPFSYSFFSDVSCIPKQTELAVSPSFGCFEPWLDVNCVVPATRSTESSFLCWWSPNSSVVTTHNVSLSTHSTMNHLQQKNIFDLQLKTLVSCKNSSNPLNNSFLGCFNGNLWLNVITVIHIKPINKSQFPLQPIQWSFISYLFGWFHPNFSWVKPPMFPIHAKIPILDGQITYSWMKWRFNPDVPFGSIKS